MAVETEYGSFETSDPEELATQGVKYAVKDFEGNGSCTEFHVATDKTGEATQLTHQAMNGDMSFSEATEARLSLNQPTIEDLLMVEGLYVQEMTPGFLESLVIERAAGIQTEVITLGFKPSLNLSEQVVGLNFHAIDIYRDRKTGRYIRLEDQNPLLQPMGKRDLVRKLVELGLIRLPFSAEGDGVNDVRMGGSLNIAVTCHARRQSAIAESHLSTSVYMGSLAVKLGEARWKGWNGRIQPLVDYGIELIAMGVVVFHNPGLEEAFVQRAEFHLDPSRDRDRVLYLPRNGILFERGR